MSTIFIPLFMTLLEASISFNQFSSLYELIGGISLALIGFRWIRNHYIKNYSKRYGESINSFRNLVLDLNLLQIEWSRIKEAQFLIIRHQKIIDKEISKIELFVEKISLRNEKDEKEVFDNLFTRSSIWSICFVISLLITAGLEQSFCFVNKYGMKFFFWYYIEIIILFGVFLLFSQVWFITKKIFWVGKVKFSNVFSILILFIIGSVLPIILTKYIPLFSAYKWIVIPLSFISSIAVYPFYIYRHIYIKKKIKIFNVNINQHSYSIRKIRRIYKIYVFSTLKNKTG